MSEEKQNKLNWQRLLITTGFVLLAALVVGGTTWYVMDKSAKEVQTANEKSVAELQKEIDELKNTSATQTTTDNAKTTENTSALKNFTHTSPNFSFRYPATLTATGDTATDPTVWLSTDGTRANTTMQISYEETKNIDPKLYFESLVASNSVPTPYTINGYGVVGAYKAFHVDYSNQGKTSSVYYIYNNGNTYTISYPGAQTEAYTNILKTLQLN